MNKGQPRERQNVLFIGKWYLFAGLFCLYIKEGLLKCDLYLHCGLYPEVAYNTGLTVDPYIV